MIPPNIPEDCRELWRVVAECIEVLNALQNMTVRVEGKIHMLGRLNMSSGSCELVIEEKTEVGSLGT
jgi:hypothetical protein